MNGLRLQCIIKKYFNNMPGPAYKWKERNCVVPKNLITHKAPVTDEWKFFALLKT